MNFGAFTLVILLESKGYAGESVSDFNGLAQRNMPAAIVMLLFLLSLAGIPPTAGFIGKYYLFTAAMKAGYAWLAVLAVVMSAVSLFYYFRIAAAMFFTEGAATKLKSSYALTAVVAICATGTLVDRRRPAAVSRDPEELRPRALRRRAWRACRRQGAHRRGDLRRASLPAGPRGRLLPRQVAGRWSWAGGSCRPGWARRSASWRPFSISSA